MFVQQIFHWFSVLLVLKIGFCIFSLFVCLWQAKGSNWIKKTLEKPNEQLSRDAQWTKTSRTIRLWRDLPSLFECKQRRRGTIRELTMNSIDWRLCSTRRWTVRSEEKRRWTNEQRSTPTRPLCEDRRKESNIRRNRADFVWGSLRFVRRDAIKVTSRPARFPANWFRTMDRRSTRSSSLETRKGSSLIRTTSTYRWCVCDSTSDATCSLKDSVKWLSCVRMPSSCFNDLRGVTGLSDCIEQSFLLAIGSIEWWSSNASNFRLLNCSIDQLKIFDRISFDRDKWDKWNDWSRFGNSVNASL